MARQPKPLAEKLLRQFEIIVRYTKRHPWTLNVWTALLFLGAVYFVYKFIAPIISR